jgi:hypothetical protein
MSIKQTVITPMFYGASLNLHLNTGLIVAEGAYYFKYYFS